MIAKTAKRSERTYRRLKPPLVVRCCGDIVPEGLPFELVNQAMKKKAISRLINACYRVVGLKATVIFADQLMYTGFRVRDQVRFFYRCERLGHSGRERRN